MASSRRSGSRGEERLDRALSSPGSMHTHLFILTVAIYGASLALYLIYLYANRNAAAWGATLCLAGGIALHYLVLLERSRWIHAVPYQDLYGSMSLFGWLLAVTYLGLELLHRQRSVGAFVVPFVILLFLAAHLSPGNAPPPAPARGPLFAFHVTLSILAYAAFAISFVLSVIFLVQERFLRGHKLAPVFWRFPPLELLERMSRSSVLIGLGSMAVGIVFGYVWVERLRGNIWSPDAKNLVTLLVFAVYAAYILLGRSSSWRGARASALCVFNFVFVMLSYTVVNLYLSHYHRYF